MKIELVIEISHQTTIYHVICYTLTNEIDEPSLNYRGR